MLLLLCDLVLVPVVLLVANSSPKADKPISSQEDDVNIVEPHQPIAH